MSLDPDELFNRFETLVEQDENIQDNSKPDPKPEDSSKSSVGESSESNSQEFIPPQVTPDENRIINYIIDASIFTLLGILYIGKTIIQTFCLIITTITGPIESWARTEFVTVLSISSAEYFYLAGYEYNWRMYEFKYKFLALSFALMCIVTYLIIYSIIWAAVAPIHYIAKAFIGEK